MKYLTVRSVLLGLILGCVLSMSPGSTVIADCNSAAGGMCQQYNDWWADCVCDQVSCPGYQGPPYTVCYRTTCFKESFLAYITHCYITGDAYYQGCQTINSLPQECPCFGWICDV